MSKAIEFEWELEVPGTEDTHTFTISANVQPGSRGGHGPYGPECQEPPEAEDLSVEDGQGEGAEARLLALEPAWKKKAATQAVEEAESFWREQEAEHGFRRKWGRR